MTDLLPPDPESEPVMEPDAVAAVTAALAEAAAKRKHSLRTALIVIAACVSVILNLVGIGIGVVGFQRATSATSKNTSLIAGVQQNAAALAALTKVKRAANAQKFIIAAQRLTDASTAQCGQGNAHRLVTNGDAKDTFDVLSLLVTAIANPSGKQTKASRALGSVYLKRLRKDVTGLRALPPIDCAESVAHPLVYVAPPSTTFKLPPLQPHPAQHKRKR